MPADTQTPVTRAHYVRELCLRQSRVNLLCAKSRRRFVVAGVSLCFRGFNDEHHLFSLGHVPNHNAIILPSRVLVGGAVHAGHGGGSEMLWRRNTYRSAKTTIKCES